MDRWISFLVVNNYSKSTISTYKSVINCYKNIINNDQKIKSKIKSFTTKPNTCILHYNVLRSYFKWSNNYDCLKSLADIKLPKLEMKYHKIITKNKLTKKVLKIPSPQASMVLFLFKTGLRVSEIKNIISYNEKSIKLLGKGNKIRNVFHDLDITKQCIPCNVSSKTIRLWVKRVLGNEYTPHSIRRSFATHMINSGANPKMIMMQLGHAKIETTYRYVQLNEKDNWKIYNKHI